MDIKIKVGTAWEDGPEKIGRRGKNERERETVASGQIFRFFLYYSGFKKPLKQTFLEFLKREGDLGGSRGFSELTCFDEKRFINWNRNILQQKTHSLLSLVRDKLELVSQNYFEQLLGLSEPCILSK